MARNLAVAVLSLVVFFGLFEGILALSGVEPTLAARDPFVGFAAQLPLYVESESEPGVLVTAPSRLGHFNAQRFERRKPPGTRRIFCLGGSTTYGRPYDDATSWCGWLRVLLRRVDPGGRWEVVNAGGISYASYRIAHLVDEITAYEPDLLILYTGHNEFLERRTYPQLLSAQPWLIDLRVRLNRTRTYSWLASGLNALRERSPEARGEDTLSAEVDAILDRSAGLSYYSRENLQRDAALRHFRFNLERMIDAARAAGAELLLVRPASNLRDSSPFKSEPAPGLGSAETRRAAALRDEAAEASAAGDAPRALAALDRALEIDAGHAGAWYRRGRALVALGRVAEWRRDFERARDEDVAPLRAPAAFLETVTRVASERRVPLVDFEALAAAASPGGAPGTDWFLDHVHPTIAAHGRLAAALLDALVETGALDASAEARAQAWTLARGEVEGGVNHRAHGLAQKNLAKVLSWAGKHEEAYRAAQRGIERVGHWHWEVHAVAARAAAQLQQLELAVEHQRTALALAPANAPERLLLGQLLLRAGRPEEAAEEFRRVAGRHPRLPAAWSGLARAQLELAQRHRLAGRPGEARAAARLALTHARRGGAADLAARAEAELSAAGGPGRR